MRIFIISFVLLFSAHFTNGQQQHQEFGGGEFIMRNPTDNCLSISDRQEIQTRLTENSRQLQAEGKLVVSNDRVDVAFEWPLRMTEELTWNSYYGVSNFVDQNATIGEIQDYNCNNRTYDNHKGLDIFTWPFPWYLYDNDFVEVIAGESGVIIEKDDGYEDDHCECIGSWNAVYIQHEDGSVAWYGHMKRYSLTEKNIGDHVEKGEFLGVVASSGCSTGPHLHLEVYDTDVNLIDPCSGTCNSLNAETWWALQPSYREPTLNTILTHDAPPEHGCPGTNEDPHLQNDFFVGDNLYTAFYFHDALAGTSTSYKLKTPDGTVWNSWSNIAPATYTSSWWYWSWELPTEGPFGEWRVEAEYQGETLIHTFNYGIYAGQEKNISNSITLIPNPSNTGSVSITGLTQNINTITIYDVSGRKVETCHPTENQINTSHLSRGIYYIAIETNVEQLTKQLIIE